MAANSFSIDLGQRFIKMAEVELNKNNFSAKSLIVQQMPNDIYNAQTEKDIENIANLIKQLTKQSSIKSNQVNIVIPDSHSYMRIIEMPKLTEKELITAIKYQADQFIPIPIENVSLDIDVISEDKKNKKVLVLLLAAANSVVDKVVAIVEQSGLIPMSVESEAVSTIKLVKTIFNAKDSISNKSPLILFVNFGYSSTSLYLYNIATQLPIETYTFSLGLELFIKDIQANYNIELDKIERALEVLGFEDKNSQLQLSGLLSAPYNEFTNEMERFIVSVKNKYKTGIGRVLLFGEGIRVNGFDKKLTQTLAVPVSIFDISQFFLQNKAVSAITKDMPILVPAVGSNLQ